MSAEQAIPGPWFVEACQTHRRKLYWAIWRFNGKFYGGQQYLQNPSRTDRKRFLSIDKANAMAETMNQADAAAQKTGAA